VSRSEGTIDPTHRFNGKELDPESGLYYYGGRYYDAEISRFISADPFIQAPSDPQNLNRYSYVNNNPQNYVDPSGYFFKKLFKKIFKRVFQVVFPVHALAYHLQSKISSLTPPKVNAGFQIFVGAAMLLNQNPAGLFFIASGATAFGQSNGWQMASGALGLAGVAASGGAFGGTPGLGGGAGNDFPGGFGGLMLAAAGRTFEGKTNKRSFSPGDDTIDPPLDILLHARWWIFRNPRPPVTQPKPPGWTPEWQWRYPEHNIGGTRRWFDPKGGEWRWHAPDSYHPQGHWDYNPWDQWNSPWRNLDPTGRPLPSGPPSLPPYGIPDLMPDPRA
jgi:RHS repeat-associated protein